jgi:hypothetical protein
MPYQVDDALLHAMSGTELSRVPTELRLLPPEPNNQRLLASRGADIVMQSSGIWIGEGVHHFSPPCNHTRQRVCGYAYTHAKKGPPLGLPHDGDGSLSANA